MILVLVWKKDNFDVYYKYRTFSMTNIIYCAGHHHIKTIEVPYTYQFILKLRLQQLVTHDQVGRSNAGSEESNEDCGQLVFVVDGERQVLCGHQVYRGYVIM